MSSRGPQPATAAAARPTAETGGRRRSDIGAVLLVWALWLSAVVGFVGLAVTIGAIGSGPAHHGMPGVVREGALWPLRSWDFARYGRIALSGYPSGRIVREDAFFPLWPAVLAGLRPLAHPALAGGVVSWLSSAAAFVGVARLNPDGDARRTAVALAAMPGSFALALVYPDGLALAAAVWACLLLQRGPRWAAPLVAVIPGLARPNGFLLAVPLALLARRVGGRWAWTTAAAPVAASAAVHLFLWRRTGDGLAFAHAQRYWHRGAPWNLVTGLVGDTRHGHLQTVVEACVAALAVWLCVRLWRRGPDWRPWALYATAVLLLSLGSGSYQSIPRQALFAFPLVWAAARSTPLLSGRRAVAAGIVANAGLILALPLMPP